MAKEVKLILTAEDNVSDVIRKVSEYLGDSGMGQAITAASTSFLALEKAMELVAGAAEKVFSVIEEGAAEAAKAENTNKMLAMSMSSVGQYTEKAFLAIDEWADSLENATGMEAEAFKTTVSLGLQMGMSAEQARAATAAAMDLAAATGTDLDSAFKQIGMTLSGSAGKLEKFIPELRELTKEELENGMAVEVIARKYDGFAANMAGGYTGSMAKFQNAVGKIPEAFGRLIAQNPAVIASIDAITNALVKTAEQIDEFSTWVLQNGQTIKELAIAIGSATAIVVAYQQANNIATAATIAWNTVVGTATTVQKIFSIQTAASTATVQAQSIMEKAAAAIKGVFNTATYSQIAAEKGLQASLIAGLVIQKTRQAYETAMVAIKNLLTMATLKASAAEAAGNAQMAISNGIQKASAAITGALAAVKGALTLENLKNTASTIANTVATAAMSVATGALAVGIGIVTIAQNALNVALNANPIGLTIIAIAGLTAGIYYLYKNLDMITGALKVGLGYALGFVSVQLTMLLTGVAKLVGFFNEDWGKAIQGAADKIESMSENLKESGRAQMALAEASKKSANDQTTSALMVQRATDGIKTKLNETAQETLKLNAAFAKALEQARSAFSGLKDFMPRMNLNEFKNDAAAWSKSIESLKVQAEALKVKLSVGVDAEGAKEQLQKVNEQLNYALEAEQALKIKMAVETRSAVIKEEQIRLDQVKAKEYTTAQEISQMRIAQAQTLRDQSIELETQRLLAMRDLASVDAQAGITVKQAAMAQANEMEIGAYKAQLETQKVLALDMETQKQLALAELKANALGSESAGGKGAQNQVEIIAAQQKQAELARLRQMDILNETEYQAALSELRVSAITMRTEQELILLQQRQALLGTSPEAMALALEGEKIQAQNELLILQEKYAAQLITDEEFRIAKEEAEMASMERQSQIKQQMLQRDLQQNQTLKNQWGATLAAMRLEQEKHGMLMGTIKGIQQSKEYGAANQALSDLSSLRSSSDKKAFEAGKIAAIAQATVQTFLAATGAYASLAPIPIVGPALGIAAAAAAIAAGINNVAQIKSQKFQGGAHGGIDEVPKSMNNSTFVLKAGERVVQPDQNKELGAAVDKINEGGSGGNNIYITVGNDVPDSTIAKIKDSVMDAIRETSERGTPIMHEKGIVRG